MSKKNDQRRGKPFDGFALYNYGNPWGAFTSRRQATEYAQECCGEPWSKCRAYFTIERVRVEFRDGAVK